MPFKTWTLDSGAANEGLRVDLTRAQDRLGLAVDELASSPLTGCKIVSVTFTGAGSADVYHRLGKRLTGWIVIDRDTAATVYNSSAGANDRREFITLTASAAVTLTILVF
jgi:hypothetical protein